MIEICFFLVVLNEFRMGWRFECKIWEYEIIRIKERIEILGFVFLVIILMYNK